jgi:Sugar-transfer associated ATP-grasp
MNSSARIPIAKLTLELLRDPERKSILKIIGELIRLLVLYKEMPTHYFSRYLFKRKIVNVTQYLPNKFLYKLKAKFNDALARELLEDKLLFDTYFRQFHIPVLGVVAHNQQNIFSFQGQEQAIDTAEVFTAWLKKLFDKIQDDSIFIKKTKHSYHGDNIHKVYKNELDHEVAMADLFSTLKHEAYLFQRTATQHTQLTAFNPSCLNTLRIDTFIDKEGKAEVISAYLRTNIANHYIDNDRKSGCEISIDLEAGKLKKHGYLALKYNGLKMPDHHPTSNMVFESFLIPAFNEAIYLALQAATHVPALRLVGWDVAISPAGPVLVEGNPDYYIPSSDMAYGGYLNNPVFQKVLSEIGWKF